jgi:hypothetical protein
MMPPVMDAYKIPLPLSSMTFCTVSSRLATLTGQSRDTLGELVHTLTVHRDFQTCHNPENYLARELKTAKTGTGERRFMLLDASNLGCCATCLRRLNSVCTARHIQPGG